MYNVFSPMLVSVVMLSIFLMGCLSPNDDNSHAYHPHIGEHDRCHMCGMMITKYPGPKGALELANSSVNPKFCSTRDMFNYALQPENTRRIVQMSVHDIEQTDWAKPSNHHFISANSAWYVYGSSKEAVMGTAVASFASEQGANQFAANYGGKVIRFEQIDLALLAED
ncbi:nitrous oxide reductase accessory protein NosL [Shewanella sp. MMG014]|uniref:nitrous oxide reductase accessory protein NosL n=1 Tax=Shewanella sp. MMG014 TaxID=2822691 RepID=UPI001FFD36AA|nr:nitrous oxide reductase accessory protein NosL [Shewanella sp. MMG014]